MSVVTVEQVATYLNLGTDQLGELQSIVAAAIGAVEQMAGPLTLRAAVTETVHGADTLLVSQAPVHEVTAITDGIDPASLDLADAAVGLIRLPAGRYRQSYAVTYVPGRAEVPGELVLAVKEAARHLWELRSGGSTYGPTTTPVEDLPHVRALVGDHHLLPSIG